MWLSSPNYHPASKFLYLSFSFFLFVAEGLVNIEFIIVNKM